MVMYCRSPLVIKLSKNVGNNIIHVHVYTLKKITFIYKQYIVHMSIYNDTGDNETVRTEQQDTQEFRTGQQDAQGFRTGQEGHGVVCQRCTMSRRLL